MHLQRLQRALFLRRLRLFQQKTQPAGGDVGLKLAVPLPPVLLGEPLAEPGVIARRQRFDFALDLFNLHHHALLLLRRTQPLRKALRLL